MLALAADENFNNDILRGVRRRNSARRRTAGVTGTKAASRCLPGAACARARSSAKPTPAASARISGAIRPSASSPPSTTSLASTPLAPRCKTTAAGHSISWTIPKGSRPWDRSPAKCDVKGVLHKTLTVPGLADPGLAGLAAGCPVSDRERTPSRPRTPLDFGGACGTQKGLLHSLTIAQVNPSGEATGVFAAM
jgi:hypothetical protein